MGSLLPLPPPPPPHTPSAPDFVRTPAPTHACLPAHAPFPPPPPGITIFRASLHPAATVLPSPCLCLPHHREPSLCLQELASAVEELAARSQAAAATSRRLNDTEMQLAAATAERDSLRLLSARHSTSGGGAFPPAADGTAGPASSSLVVYQGPGCVLGSCRAGGLSGVFGARGPSGGCAPSVPPSEVSLITSPPPRFLPFMPHRAQEDPRGGYSARLAEVVWASERSLLQDRISELKADLAARTEQLAAAREAAKRAETKAERVSALQTVVSQVEEVSVLCSPQPGGGHIHAPRGLAVPCVCTAGQGMRLALSPALPSVSPPTTPSLAHAPAPAWRMWSGARLLGGAVLWRAGGRSAPRCKRRWPACSGSAFRRSAPTASSRRCGPRCAVTRVPRCPSPLSMCFSRRRSLSMVFQMHCTVVRCCSRRSLHQQTLHLPTAAVAAFCSPAPTFPPLPTLSHTPA